MLIRDRGLLRQHHARWFASRLARNSRVLARSNRDKRSFPCCRLGWE